MQNIHLKACSSNTNYLDEHYPLVKQFMEENTFIHLYCIYLVYVLAFPKNSFFFFKYGNVREKKERELTIIKKIALIFILLY